MFIILCAFCMISIFSSFYFNLAGCLSFISIEEKRKKTIIMAIDNLKFFIKQYGRDLEVRETNSKTNE